LEFNSPRPRENFIFFAYRFVVFSAFLITDYYCDAAVFQLLWFRRWRRSMLFSLHAILSHPSILSKNRSVSPPLVLRQRAL